MEDTNNIIEQWEQEITEQAELETLNEVGIYKGEGILIRIDAVDTEEKDFQEILISKYLTVKAIIRLHMNLGYL